MISVPAASANLSTASFSPSPPLELNTIPRSLGLPVSKFIIPFMMLLAA